MKRTQRDDERQKRQSRKMASDAQGQWAGKHPIWNCCMTVFALGFLLFLGILVALGAMGVFDNLG